MKNYLCRALTICTMICATAASSIAADSKMAPQLPPVDNRYKADLLLVVAHPDDDTVVSGYLAKISLDDRKRVAVIYCTSGDGGGNAMGFEAGAALGQMRVIEARRALGFLGIENVWFLGGHDTPGQNVLWSLDNWNHGRALDEVVRLVRLTRPEVILTFLPSYVVGENHDDHQAAGVLATEAFDMAGNPLMFPEQVAPPRDRTGMSNLTEGLHPWQPKKLYFTTDAFENFGPYWHEKGDLSPFRENFVIGSGPQYPNTAVSPARHESYAKLQAEQQAFYLTQEGAMGKEALENNDLRGFEYPTQLIFGRSLVGGTKTGDVFEGIGRQPVAFTPARGYRPEEAGEVTFDVSGPWAFYRDFRRAHDLGELDKLIPVPEAAVEYGHVMHIPLLISNRSAQAVDVTLDGALPQGWQNEMRYSVFPLRAGEFYPVDMAVRAPAKGEHHWSEMTWRAKANGRTVGEVRLRVFAGKTGGLPQ